MEYRRCSFCVMDTIADPNIIFDADGNCNYCTEALARSTPQPISQVKKDSAAGTRRWSRSSPMVREKPMTVSWASPAVWILPILPIWGINGGCESLLSM